MRRIPDIDSPFLLEPESLRRRDDGTVDWDDAFDRARPLRIEVGVGNSPFLIEVARLEEPYNYLGFEYSRKRVLKFLKRVDNAGIENVRILRLNATVVLGDGVREGEVDHIFINFPDPWPKRRHAKKRFVQNGVMRPVIQLLRHGGGISLRTDVAPYAEQMLEVLDSSEGLENLSGRGCFAEQPTYPFRTAYEARFLEEGRRIHYLEYRRVASDADD